MEPIKAIQYLFPNASLSDFEVIRYPDNTWEITKWNVGTAQPTEEELQKAWNDYLSNVDPSDDLKKAKMIELEQACGQAIVGTFTAQVNGVTYSFSNSTSAQSNFKDAKDAWTYGYIPNTQTIKWTAYDSNGNVVRLDLTEEQFDPVNIARMTWQQTNVSKLRDILEPQVNAATSQTDLDKIVW
jgi:membrane peptidoglycan carboxypeptidase